MSGLFPVLGVAASGANAAQTWLTATGDNIANANTVRPAGEEPFRAFQVVTESEPDGGVKVTRIERDTTEPDRVWDPENPLADADGYINRPVVDLSLEMTNMMAAQRLFSMNLAVHRTGIDTYRQALNIGSR